MSIDPTAKVFGLIGICLLVLALGWQMGWIQALRLGRLPGDILIERENMRFYFPITTGILLSALFSLGSWLLRR